MRKMNEYLSNGISINPASPTSQDVVEIKYDGLLPQSGAAEVFAHVSFDDQWHNVYDYKMTRSRDGFVTSIHLPVNADAVNFCFRDSANNWDNNYGRNYSVNVYRGYFANRFDSDLGKAHSSNDVFYSDDIDIDALRAGSEWC